MAIQSPLRISSILAFLLSTLLVCAGCDDRKVVIGGSAPAISGTDIEGKPVSLDNLKGRTVLICFWTNSCCGGSVRALEPLYRKYQGKGLTILAINELDAKRDLESFAKANGLSFPILMDEHSKLLKQYLVFAFPTFFIVDGNGVVRKKILGGIASAKLEELVLRQIDVQRKAEQSYEKLHSR